MHPATYIPYVHIYIYALHANAARGQQQQIVTTQLYAHLIDDSLEKRSVLVALPPTILMLSAKLRCCCFCCCWYALTLFAAFAF